MSGSGDKPKPKMPRQQSGRMGGRARAAALSAERRREIAAEGGKARAAKLVGRLAKKRIHIASVGGYAAAEKLTAEQRRAKASKAAKARWAKKQPL